MRNIPTSPTPWEASFPSRTTDKTRPAKLVTIAAMQKPLIWPATVGALPNTLESWCASALLLLVPSSFAVASATSVSPDLAANTLRCSGQSQRPVSRVPHRYDVSHPANEPSEACVALRFET